MKITSISVWQTDLPLGKPYYLSGGRLRFDSLDSTFVRIDTDSGIHGWGEGCPWGHTYLPAHGDGIRAGLSLLAPHLIGVDPCAHAVVNQLMDAQLPGHPYVKSAIDIACWDITGKAAGMPLWRLFGADCANPVALNSSISTGTPDDMLQLIAEARAKGYKTHSAKIGGENAAIDIERINCISASISESHADEHVTFDVNRAWTPSVALQVLNTVKSRDWVEQPCETLQQCTQVAAKVPQPIMLDECLHTFNDHLTAWRHDACAGVKVKPNRLGGLTRCKQIIDFGIAVGWRMHIEDVGGSALADTAAIHLASATPIENRLASWLSHEHLVVDPVAAQGARNIGGFATPPSTPGLGVDPQFDHTPCAVYTG
jgi:L-alanine-DL-glutamate epimerase-like enolase superfamily enzyme